MQPVSLKLEPELHQRLQQCSELVGIKKTTLMIACLEALCDMIERAGGVETNFALARHWLTSALTNGYHEATNLLATIP